MQLAVILYTNYTTTHTVTRFITDKATVYVCIYKRMMQQYTEQRILSIVYNLNIFGQMQNQYDTHVPLYNIVYS